MDVFSKLLVSRDAAANVPPTAEAGVYGFFARRRDCLPAIELGQSDLIYIGISRNLAERNHFRAKHSGFHTLRRTRYRRRCDPSFSPPLRAMPKNSTQPTIHSILAKASTLARLLAIVKVRQRNTLSAK